MYAYRQSFLAFWAFLTVCQRAKNYFFDTPKPPFHFETAAVLCVSVVKLQFQNRLHALRDVEKKAARDEALRGKIADITETIEKTAVRPA